MRGQKKKCGKSIEVVWSFWGNYSRFKRIASALFPWSWVPDLICILLKKIFPVLGTLAAEMSFLTLDYNAKIKPAKNKVKDLFCQTADPSNSEILWVFLQWKYFISLSSKQAGLGSSLSESGTGEVHCRLSLDLQFRDWTVWVDVAWGAQDFWRCMEMCNVNLCTVTHQLLCHPDKYYIVKRASLPLFFCLFFTLQFT